MRQFEDRLRAELSRTEAIVTVSKETMLARVARARRRRTLTAGIGALAGCALALTIIVPTLSGGGPLGTASTGPRLIHQGELVNVVFTDSTHGYALQQRCTMLHPADLLPNPQGTPDVKRECEATLVATSDAGATWEERAVPAPPAHKDAGVELVDGHSMMLWVPTPGTLAMGTWKRRYWTTTDGGVTWQESPSPYELGPPGSYGILGANNQHVFLASAPPDVGFKSPVVAASDGSYWIRCEGSPCVRVSRDQGQTWQTIQVQQPGNASWWVATADGQTVYVGVRDSSNTNETLVRSTDGGVTWAPVPGVTMPFRGSGPVVMPNGDLILSRASAEVGLFRLAAGTTTFQQVTGIPANASVIYLTGGWLVAATVHGESETPDLNHLAYVSPDNGVTWIPVPKP